MEELTERPKGTGISGSTLKLIAVITMLIDHTAAAVLMRVLSSRGILEVFRGQDAAAVSAWMAAGDNRRLYLIYLVMRQIGRIAFPIYCFMLIEGLQRTRNVWKYAARLGVFALVSEIPFDLAFNGKVLEFGYQNVFFTLVIGLLTLIGLEKIAARTWNGNNAKVDMGLKIALSFVTAAAGMGLAWLLETDYSSAGIACILIMYLLRKKKWLELLGGYIAFVVLLSEIFAFPAFLLLIFYRGKKGFGLKYFFYGFYPLHLLLLYLTCVLLGIAGYPAL